MSNAILAPRNSNPTNMTKDFSQVGIPPVERSTMRRPFFTATTIRGGRLYPVYTPEVLPGDVIDLKLRMFARFITLLRPVFTPVHLDWFAFFVPERILWENWERLQGAQDDPDDSVDYLTPIIKGQQQADAWTVAPESLASYFGLPLGATFSPTNPFQQIRAAKFVANNLIWNTWFRDQDYQDSLPVPLGDGPHDIAQFEINWRNKFHDYFSSVRPSPQKGPAVMLPIGNYAPVIGTGDALRMTDGAPWWATGYTPSSAYGYFGAAGVSGSVGAAATPVALGPPSSAKYANITDDPALTTVVADLSQTAAITVNEMREAVVLQQIFELDMRGGTRYVESLFSRWKVVSPDFRLQRPEYIGGGSQRLDVEPIPQTSALTLTPEDSYAHPGDLSGVGAGLAVDRIRYSAVEHGFLFIYVNVRADIQYQNGVHRSWLRRSRWDFPEPLTMHLGEQPVYRQEMYFGANSAADETVWGYQGRWDEYRYETSYVTGLFNSKSTAPLDPWHLALNYDGENPQMGDIWLRDDPEFDRVVATPGEPPIMFEMSIDGNWTRAMPIYPTPGLVRF